MAGLIVPLMAISLTSVWTGEPEDAFRYAAVASLLAHASMFVAVYRAYGNAAHPLCLLAIHLSLMYPLHGILTYGTIEQIAVLGTEGDGYLAYGLLLETVSLPILWLGYQSHNLRRLSEMLPRFGWRVNDDAKETYPKLAMLYIVASLARIPLLTEGLHLHLSGARTEDASDMGAVKFVLQLIGDVPRFICWYILVVGLTRKRRPMVMASLGLMAVELAWGLSSGSRMEVLWPLAGVVIAAATCWKPLRLPQLVTGIAIFITIALPFSVAYRTAFSGRVDEIRRDGVETSTITSSLLDAVEGSNHAQEESGVDFLAGRLHGLTSLALIIRYTPERSDYQFGLSYLMIPIQIIVPRAVWPDKPPLAPFVEVFRRQYWGVPDDSETSVAVSQLGDFWVNLHFPGVLLGTFVFGGIVAFLHLRLRCGTDGTSLLPKVVFVALIPHILGATEGAFTGFLVTLPKIILIYMIVAWVLSSRTHRDVLSTPKQARRPHAWIRTAYR